MNLNAWEREQIDRYIKNGGKVTRITVQEMYERMEAQTEAARERASKRSIEFHRKRKMRGL